MGNFLAKVLGIGFDSGYLVQEVLPSENFIQDYLDVMTNLDVNMKIQAAAITQQQMRKDESFADKFQIFLKTEFVPVGDCG